MTAWRGSLAGVEQRVRQERPSCAWLSRARVCIGSRQASKVRRVRVPPAMTSSAPSWRMVTAVAGIIVSDTGAGPQAGLHC